ncbi:MAG: CopG family transcriptional regulator [Dehalococcoidia bacterium]|nr:CopG family transcriptional regulator [Dehalococcoidia bacterium]
MLSNDLYEKIQERVTNTEFNSVDEYVIFVMEEVLKDEEDQALSKEDEEEIKKKLKAFGYLE